MYRDLSLWSQSHAWLLECFRWFGALTRPLGFGVLELELIRGCLWIRAVRNRPTPITTGPRAVRDRPTP